MTSICGQIHECARQLTRYRYPFDPASLPSNGLYLLFEQGEDAHGGERIVRVGSHRGRDNLAKRLCKHFVAENKDRSIFRKNIGRAILSRNEDRFPEQWEWDLISRANRAKYQDRLDWDRLREVEGEVTAYIRHRFRFAVLPVSPDKAQHLAFEADMIATVAQCPCCGPSPKWLGQYSPKAAIRDSGLWQTQHIRGKPLTFLSLERVSL